MLDPVVFLVGCLLATGGGWAFPQPAQPGPPPPPAPPPPSRGRELGHLFPRGQLSRMGRAPLVIPNLIPSMKIYEEARHDPAQLPAYYAHFHALQTQYNLIYHVMRMDEAFLTCMEEEMGRSLIGTASDNAADLFFAAEVCQRLDKRDFGIHFPRVEMYLPQWEEGEQYSEPRIVARVTEKAKAKAKAEAKERAKQRATDLRKERAMAKAEAKEKEKAMAEAEEKATTESKSPNAFHTLPAPAPPRHGLLSSMMSRLSSRLSASAQHWEMDVKRLPWTKVRTPWGTAFQTEPNALLLERHY
ncbi:MAG: hypothetical protein M1826_002353 [Phylliscum demangeonii]|nr:MAG: hypothetical protein M1826_002353 [Phylliscum demangeonii]